MTKRLLRIFSVAVCCLAMGACAGSTKPREEAVPAPPVKPPVPHAVHSERLRTVMLELEEITLENLPEGLDISQARAAHRREIVRLADELARAAVDLPGTLTAFDLPDQSAPRFYELADELRKDALALRSRAAEGDLGSARDETEKLLATCNSCHAEMRLAPAVESAPSPF